MESGAPGGSVANTPLFSTSNVVIEPVLRDVPRGNGRLEPLTIGAERNRELSADPNDGVVHLTPFHMHLWTRGDDHGQLLSQLDPLPGRIAPAGDAERTDVAVHVHRDRGRHERWTRNSPAASSRSRGARRMGKVTDAPASM